MRVPHLPRLLVLRWSHWAREDQIALRGRVALDVIDNFNENVERCEAETKVVH